MSIVRISLKIDDLEIQTKGIRNHNTIKFLMDKKSVTITVNDNMIEMNRYENDKEYTFIRFHLIDPMAYYYYLKKYPLKIKVNKLTITNNEIHILYDIEDIKHTFILTYEEGESND